MSVLKDIVDILKDKKLMGDIKGSLSSKQASLSRKASEGTLQFAVLVSRSLDIDTAQMISKALERNFSSFAQIVFSMNPVLHTHQGVSGADFIKQFHQNSGTKPNTLELTKTMMDIFEGYNEFELNENFTILSMTYESATAQIYASHKEQLIDLMDYVRTDILNNKYKPKMIEYRPVYEKKSSKNIPDPKDLRDYQYRVSKDDRDYYFKQSEFKYRQDKDSKDFDYRLSKDDKDYSFKQNEFDYRKNKDSKDMDYRLSKDSQELKIKQDSNYIKQKELEYRKYKDSVDREDKFNTTPLNQNMLRDNDVKKANELIPTTLHVRIKLLSSDGAASGFLDFMVGIKAMMHPINTNEMVSNLVGACQNNDKVFNFIRWTTGEISFFKDFLFNIQELKTDIVNRSMGASPWWIALKRRKSMAKIKDALFSKNKMLPNATIVTSIDEVEKIKAEYGFDLMNKHFVEKIMSTYFLLGFVVVDNSSQIAHFLFDGQESFESVSFSGLEKENSRDERKFKEMLKAINRN